MDHNGNGAAPEQPATWMRLDYDHAAGKLNITGSIPSVEIARCILAMASWEYEAQWRQNRAKQFAQELQEAGKVRALSESLFGKGN